MIQPKLKRASRAGHQMQSQRWQKESIYAGEEAKRVLAGLPSLQCKNQR